MGTRHSVIMEEEIASRRRLKSGPMLKQGQISKNWKERWFVLSPNSLSYYTDETCTNQCGSIPVSDIVEILVGDPQEWSKVPGAFILKTTVRDYFFMVEDHSGGNFKEMASIDAGDTASAEDKQRDRWIIAISHAIVELQAEKKAVAELVRLQQQRHQSRPQAPV